MVQTRNRAHKRKRSDDEYSPESPQDISGPPSKKASKAKPAGKKEKPRAEPKQKKNATIKSLPREGATARGMILELFKMDCECFPEAYLSDMFEFFFNTYRQLAITQTKDREGKILSTAVGDLFVLYHFVATIRDFVETKACLEEELEAWATPTSFLRVVEIYEKTKEEGITDVFEAIKAVGIDTAAIEDASRTTLQGDLEGFQDRVELSEVFEKYRENTEEDKLDTAGGNENDLPTTQRTNEGGMADSQSERLDRAATDAGEKTTLLDLDLAEDGLKMPVPVAQMQVVEDKKPELLAPATETKAVEEKPGEAFDDLFDDFDEA